MSNSLLNKQNKLDGLVLFILTSVIIIYLLHFFNHDLSKIFGDLGDGRLNNYFLEHGYQYLLGNHSSFWSAPFYYPAENVMTYSDNHLGTLPFYSLFRLFGYDIETSYQLWMILIFLLNGISAYMVLRLFGFNILGSFVGALFFSIAAPAILKSNHIQLMPRFMIPILFYAGLKYVETLNIKYFYIFSFAFVYQFYMGIYIGFFSIIGFILLLPFIIMYIFNNHNLKNSINLKYIVHLLFVTIVSVILLLMLFEPYLTFKELTGGRTWGEISSMLPRVKSWFYTMGSFFDYFNYVGEKLPMKQEHIIFVGLVPYAIFIFVLYYIKRRSNILFGQNYTNIIFASIIIISFTYILTLYANGFSFYKYTFYQIPGFDAIRAVSRIVLFLLFPFAVLLAFFITSFLKSTQVNHIKNLLIIWIVILISLEQYRENISTYDKQESQVRYMKIYENIKKIKDYDVIYLLINKPSPDFFMDELDAMFLSLMVNKPTLNGYSGNMPVGYELLDNNDYLLWLKNKRTLNTIKVLILEGDTIKIINMKENNNATNIK